MEPQKSDIGRIIRASKDELFKPEGVRKKSNNKIAIAEVIHPERKSIAFSRRALTQRFVFFSLEFFIAFIVIPEDNETIIEMKKNELPKQLRIICDNIMKSSTHSVK
ncbi:MAG: hypothetical protein GY854_08980 [Deltaproteobacteria bacterium]|nr:hypothetical protein [Deltaproteobacteria bacterium]